MNKPKKTFYLTNKDLLREIHNSKMTYCWTHDENYTHFDLIVTGFDEVTPEAVAEAKQNRATRLQKLAHQVEVARWEKGLTGKGVKIGIMGCIVNGPGESKHADIGISLPGTGEAPAAPVFIDGEKKLTLRGDNIAQEFTALIDAYVENKYKRV